MNRVDTHRFSFISIINTDFITAAFHTQDRSGKAMKTRVKSSFLNNRMSLQSHFISRHKFLKVFTQRHLSLLSNICLKLMAGFLLSCPNTLYHTGLFLAFVYKAFGDSYYFSFLK